MARFLLAGGVLAALMGASLIPPVMVAQLESGAPTALGMGVVSVGCGLIACGAIGVLVGYRQRVASMMPSGVRMAVAANVLFLAFFALELSDGLVRQDGRVFYWTTVLFLPALVLFCGLVAAQRWAWWIFRGATALGVVWFLGFVAVIPLANLQSDGVPAPWYGRVWAACVSVALAGILFAAFRSLGRQDTRRFFGLIRTEDEGRLPNMPDSATPATSR